MAVGGLDQYLVGDAGRISREYSVMIPSHERDEFRLGGAANTAANLVSRYSAVPGPRLVPYLPTCR